MAELQTLEGDPDRVALIVPGLGYTAAYPLLYYAAEVLGAQGWTVVQLWWQPPERVDDWNEWVTDQVEPVLTAQTAAQVLLVGKSIGSHAAGLAVDRGLPAVWLTPLLHRDRVRDSLAAGAARGLPALLVGGSVDSTWDRTRVPDALAVEVLELAGADHALQYPDDPVGSVDLLREVVTAVDRFARGLGER